MALRTAPLLVLALLLAGCAADPAPRATPLATADPTAPDPAVTDETGSIAGRVVDQELRPIPEAAVGILEPLGPKATTDPAGRFTFNQVAPGSVVVGASAIGYEPFTVRVLVEAGRVAEVLLTLNAVPQQIPYVENWQHNGYMELGIGTPVISPRPGTNNQLNWKHNIVAGLNTTISTMVWTPTTAFSATQFQLLIDTNGDNAFDKAGRSPHIARIDDHAGVEPGFIRHDVLVPRTCGCAANPPNGLIDPVYGQRFTIYASAFYFELAPAGFSNAPDA